MSTTALLPPGPRRVGTDDEQDGPNLFRVVRSEWIKVRTLRSSAVTLLLALISLAGLGPLIALFVSYQLPGMGAEARANFDVVGASLGGLPVAELVIGVLGVLIVTGEYSTGMIRSTFSALPTRLPVLWAKAIVYAGVTAALMIPAAFVAFLVGQQILGSHGVALSAPGALRVVVGAGLYLTVVAIIAVALGFLVRHTAGGIATLFAVLLVVPVLGNLTPASWQTNVLPYLPAAAGQRVFDFQPDPAGLAPWTGFAVMCAWAVAALLLAAFAIRRRDV